MGGHQYKIKLDSGRVLGPIGIAQIRKLILKNRILGTELAERNASGDWKNIQEFRELSDLVLAHLEGKLKSDEPLAQPPHARPQLRGQTQLQMAPTVVLNDEALSEGTPSGDLLPTGASQPDPPRAGLPASVSPHRGGTKTEIDRPISGLAMTNSPPSPESTTLDLVADQPARKISDEPTIPFLNTKKGASRPRKSKASRRKVTLWELARILLIGLGLAYAFYDEIFPPEGAGLDAVRPLKIRPTLPAVSGTPINPALSQKEYAQGLVLYQQDTVEAYAQAVQYFLKSCSHDPDNVKALAMLASTYLNLIDSSNKDENYFAVITRLIELSRSKSIDLPETVIADVELYLITHRINAAKQRIVDFTKNKHGFDPLMFYYLAEVFEAKGDTISAVRNIQLLPESKITNAQIFYFRGQLAERDNDVPAAVREYKKALKINPQHAKSILALVELQRQASRFKESRPLLAFLVNHQRLLSPPDLAHAYYLAGLQFEIYQNWELALASIERAVRLTPDNHDYLFEIYTLRARLGNRVLSAKRDARMYTHMSQGEQLVSQGKYQEALAQFMEARQANDDSIDPLIKMGDMFKKMGEMTNARMNYEIAAKKVPKNVWVWTKYIDVLIKSYEWDEAQKAMDRLRGLSGTASAIDKAAGDLYAAQSRYKEAQEFYKKAMGRDTIDSSVYLAFAHSLLETQNYKDAPFFYALARRFDPDNTDAIIGTAKSVAYGSSLDRGIELIQDELSRLGGNQAELLCGIADFQIQKGDWAAAQRFVDQAMSASPELATPWKLQAQIILGKDGAGDTPSKAAMEQALQAYKAFSDRNTSDPLGYLERYKLLTRMSRFEAAAEELNKIFLIYPKYPNLHFYKGQMYVSMGNHAIAAQEFALELANNPGSYDAQIALGREYLMVQQGREALDPLQKAMAARPNAPEPKALAAQANALLKNYAGAIALYQAAIALDPGNPLLYKRLGMVYRAMGDANQATQSFRKYIEMEPDAPDRAEFESYL